jgi:AmmeMemoRadiSam system protein B
MQIREPQVAGMFYPSDPKKLKKELDEYLSEIKTDDSIKNVAGIIAPHAGYQYSGKTAAYGYKTIQNKNFHNVIVISPSHREYFRGISIYSGDAYKTPLGNIPINKELRENIITESSLVFSGNEGHKYEHALEVQLPFLQTVLSDFQLIPMVIGDQRKEFIYELADVLAKFTDDKTLLIASSDLSHFYTKSHAQILDSRIVACINEFKYEQLQQDLEGKRCEACGGGGIVALLKALKMKNYSHSKVIAHTDSGDITGDNSEVVGYLSAVVYN